MENSLFESINNYIIDNDIDINDLKFGELTKEEEEASDEKFRTELALFKKNFGMNLEDFLATMPFTEKKIENMKKINQALYERRTDGDKSRIILNVPVMNDLKIVYDFLRVVAATNKKMSNDTLSLFGDQNAYVEAEAIPFIKKNSIRGKVTLITDDFRGSLKPLLKILNKIESDCEFVVLHDCEELHYFSENKVKYESLSPHTMRVVFVFENIGKFVTMKE